MICVVPGTDKVIDEEESPLEVIREMNQMVKRLINKIPSVKFEPWKGDPNKINKLLTELPEDINIIKNRSMTTIDSSPQVKDHIVD